MVYSGSEWKMASLIVRSRIQYESSVPAQKLTAPLSESNQEMQLGRPTSASTYNELGPDLHPLGLRLGQKAKDPPTVVIDDGQQIEVPLRGRDRKRSAEVGMESLSQLAR